MLRAGRPRPGSSRSSTHRRRAAVSRQPASAARLPVEPSRSLGDIVLHGVSVTYPGRAERALRDVDLVLPAGRRTAIVGESGAGKSTLARLLLRFVDPDAGRITVGGGALADIDVHAWRGRIAYVPQSPHLFHGTVAENIRLARPDATLDEVAAAARAAGATAFIEDLPDGLETPIGEDGVRLSGGQRQRIAVARAFLRDADLVVLDEPTAHLDPDAEASVAEAIDRLGRGRTVVVISHRSALVEGRRRRDRARPRAGRALIRGRSRDDPAAGPRPRGVQARLAPARRHGGGGRP